MEKTIGKGHSLFLGQEHVQEGTRDLAGKDEYVSVQDHGWIAVEESSKEFWDSLKRKVLKQNGPGSTP